MRPIGIDLGTTNSVICQYIKGTARVIPIEGKPTVPSVVYIDNKKNTIVGHKAKKRILLDADRTLSSSKRHIGQTSEWSKTIDGKKYDPIETAKEVLVYIKREAEKELKEKIEEFVITIPAYFTDGQRKATKEAAEKAGLKVQLLIPEPTAAAISYGFDKEKDQIILVIDLGGGTFDVSLLEVRNNKFEVKAVDGNSQLGGDDFDLAIVEYLNKWIEENTGQSVKDNNAAQQKLKEAAEEAKIELSKSPTTEIYLTNVVSDVNVEIDDFSVQDFKSLIEPHLAEVVSKTNAVLQQANLEIDDVNRIVLVGGSCKHPLVQEAIRQNFKTPYIADDMDTAVARGAALVAASKMAPTDYISYGDTDSRPVNIDVQDVIAHSLGIGLIAGDGKSKILDKILRREQLMFIPILPKNTNYPAKAAAMGYRQTAEQEAILMQVFEGEDAVAGKNIKKGELKLPISKKYILNKDVVHLGVAAIFELDASGMLTFTAVEMPVTVQTYNDIKVLSEDAEKNKNIVSYDSVESLQRKYGFKEKKVTIKI